MKDKSNDTPPPQSQMVGYDKFRNAVLEEAAKAAETAQIPGSLMRPESAMDRAKRLTQERVDDGLLHPWVMGDEAQRDRFNRAQDRRAGFRVVRPVCQYGYDQGVPEHHCPDGSCYYHQHGQVDTPCKPPPPAERMVDENHP